MNQPNSPLGIFTTQNNTLKCFPRENIQLLKYLMLNKKMFFFISDPLILRLPPVIVVRV